MAKRERTDYTTVGRLALDRVSGSTSHMALEAILLSQTVESVAWGMPGASGGLGEQIGG